MVQAMTRQHDRDRAFFETEFDDVTRTKLDIYARYLQEWLPVPLSGRMYVSEAVIYDLFCGPGTDSIGVSGSPLIAAEVIRNNQENIKKSNVQVRLVLNDYLKDHIDTLSASLGRTIVGEDGSVLANVRYHSEPFEELLPKLVDEMNGKNANLLFIDQFGMTGVDEDVFRILHSLNTTDVLFFISTNWFRRFAGRPEAANWTVTKEEIMSIQYGHVHRFVTDHFHDLVGDDYYVAPFSLKKGSNIYGLVFASHHHLGLKKFLEVAWKKDPHSGEANFDIHNEGAGDPDQLVMFEARKIDEFQADLRQRILNREFSTDSDIYLHMLKSGFINKHATSVVRKLAAKKGGQIEFRENGHRKHPRLSPPSMSNPRELVVFD